MQAVSAYLKGLQSAKGMNDAEVAAALKPLLGRDVASTTVWRAATGRTNSRLDMLLGILHVLGANPSEVMYLFTSSVPEDEAAAMGRRAALAEVGEEVIRDAWRRVPSESRAAVRERIIEELRRED